jgi:hypothetical protein
VVVVGVVVVVAAAAATTDILSLTKRTQALPTSGMLSDVKWIY